MIVLLQQVLTINNTSNYIYNSISSCDDYTWNGVTYTTSGTYTWVGTNSVGCDSTATLVLTINSPTTSTSSTYSNSKFCNDYTWNGVTYTTSGTYTWVGTNSVGCDSTATLVLTINYQHIYNNQSSCDDYTWNGVTYTTSGTYTWVGTNSVGCDSTATLVLTINSPTTSQQP